MLDNGKNGSTSRHSAWSGRLRDTLRLAHFSDVWPRSTCCALWIVLTGRSCHNVLKSLNSFSVGLLVAALDEHSQIVARPQCQAADRRHDGIRGETQPDALGQRGDAEDRFG
jgi:hypothetical protein